MTQLRVASGQYIILGTEENRQWQQILYNLSTLNKDVDFSHSIHSTLAFANFLLIVSRLYFSSVQIINKYKTQIHFVSLI